MSEACVNMRGPLAMRRLADLLDTTEHNVLLVWSGKTRVD